jgi:hypothetical protein
MHVVSLFLYDAMHDANNCMMLMWLHADRKLEPIHSKYEIEIIMLPCMGTKICCIVHIFHALFKFDAHFAPDPVIVPHLHDHRQLRCVPLHLIPMC